jgi:hypothetical protein
VSPKGLLTPEVRAEIVRNRKNLIDAVKAHGSDIFTVFAQELKESVSNRLSPNGPGWALVRSGVLRETVVFVRDEAVHPPAQAARFVTYTLAELEVLSTATREVLLQMHAGKKNFGARVVALNSLSGSGEDRAL